MDGIRVEFYGIPRSRAGAASVTVPVQDVTVRLGDVLEKLADRFPRLAGECLDGRRLKSGYIASLQGERFVTDPETTLAAGDCLLILSADAGG